jgi:hypothetical protein
VGDGSAPAGHDEGSECHPERRVGDPAVDHRRGMLFLVRGADQELSRQQHRKSIWAVAFFIIGIGLCRLLPEFDGPARMVIAVAVIGIAGYLAFLMTIDVPMYLRRWRTEVGDRSKFMRPLAGLYEVSTHWVVTHDLAEWKDEIPWMSLYFSVAVWASLALCVFYSF